MSLYIKVLLESGLMNEQILLCERAFIQDHELVLRVDVGNGNNRPPELGEHVGGGQVAPNVVSVGGRHTSARVP